MGLAPGLEVLPVASCGVGIVDHLGATISDSIRHIYRIRPRQHWRQHRILYLDISAKETNGIPAKVVSVAHRHRWNQSVENDRNYETTALPTFGPFLLQPFAKVQLTDSY